MNIIECLRDPSLFGRLFQNLESWGSWIVFLKALYAIPMTPAELEIFKGHTGRERPPSQPVSEGFAVVGRGGGKSRIAALITMFQSCFKSYAPAPGERLLSMLLAVDRRQSRIVNRYVDGVFNSVPVLKDLIVRQTSDVIDLRNETSIEISTANFRSVRGYSVSCAILDEIAYFRSEESANPDIEIVNAIRPGLGRVPGSLLLCISSPYARRGVLWNAFKKYYGAESDRVLVWVADTKTMNPLFDDSVIKEAFELDPAVAQSEYGRDGKISFRSDLESFVSREAVEACVTPGRFELALVSGVQYVGFVDPSGGSSDSMTMAVSHQESDGRIVLDALREVVPPFSPESVVKEFSDCLKSYGITTIQGDRYGGEFCREPFRRYGLDYQIADKSKSELYQAFLPLLNSSKVSLLDHPKLISQLCSLERRTHSGGRDSIDHPPGGHDDLINSVCGSVLACQGGVLPSIIEFYRREIESQTGQPAREFDFSKYQQPFSKREETSELKVGEVLNRELNEEEKLKLLRYGPSFPDRDL